MEPENTPTQSNSNSSSEPVIQKSATPSARVVEDTNGAAELLIDAEFEPSWLYLVDNLSKSDITVHSRNKAAGRVLIGCSSIDSEEVEVAKKGRWSFFKRTKKEDLDHCALQLVGGKGSTTVSVLNRSGGVVAADAAKRIFTRLLNN